MNAISRIRAEIAAEANRDLRLVDQIANLLADTNNDPMCRLYQVQAEEIMAMVREADRASRIQMAAE